MVVAEVGRPCFCREEKQLDKEFLIIGQFAELMGVNRATVNG